MTQNIGEKPRNSGTTGQNGAATPAVHFGRQVHKERVRKGWTLRDLSRETGIVPGHLSRIERGLATPTERVALAMDTVFPHRHGWFTDFLTDYAEWAPPGYLSLAPYENAATHLRVWCPGTLDGLVQTEAYARALFQTVPGVASEMITARVQARMERQRRILHRENPPSVWIGVDEPALFRLVGSPEIMAEALDHLLVTAARDRVTVQVVPSVAHGATGSEVIVTDSAAYCEHPAGSFTYTDEETATALDALITSIQAESYRASESAQMIERARDIWATGENPLSATLRVVRASKSPAPRVRSA